MTEWTMSKSWKMNGYRVKAHCCEKNPKSVPKDLWGFLTKWNCHTAHILNTVQKPLKEIACLWGGQVRKWIELFSYLITMRINAYFGENCTRSSTVWCSHGRLLRRWLANEFALQSVIIAVASPIRFDAEVFFLKNADIKWGQSRLFFFFVILGSVALTLLFGFSLPSPSTVTTSTLRYRFDLMNNPWMILVSVLWGLAQRGETG